MAETSPFAGFGNPFAAAGAAASRAVVNTAVNTGGGGAAAASFSVDPEQIPGLIGKYQEAQRKLQSIGERAKELQDVAAPGDDHVSGMMSQKLGEMAGDGPGKLSWAVDQGRQRLQGQIDQLNKALSDYQATDEAAKPSQA